MPVIIEYLGITLMFYSNEHEPIHVHAKYNDAEIKVSFFIREGKIYRTTYVLEYGNFPKSKLKLLKKLIAQYKEEIINLWTDYFIWNKSIQVIKINKKL